MDNINFTSRIRVAPMTEFYKKVFPMYNKTEVKYPWTAREIVKAPDAYTLGIKDCTAGGITDGKDVVMFHICATNPLNNCFDDIKKAISEKLDLKKPELNAFLIGCDTMYADSVRLFDRFKQLFKDFNIPTTAIKGNKGGSTDILYNQKTDEWLVTNFDINQDFHAGEKCAKKMLEKSYKEIEISPADELVI